MSQKRVPVFDPDTGTMTWGWKDEGPAYARAAGTRGELVVGISEATQERLNERRARAKKAAA